MYLMPWSALDANPASLERGAASDPSLQQKALEADLLVANLTLARNQGITRPR
jgi:hypothetical protein